MSLRGESELEPQEGHLHRERGSKTKRRARARVLHPRREVRARNLVFEGYMPGPPRLDTH